MNNKNILSHIAARRKAVKRTYGTKKEKPRDTEIPRPVLLLHLSNAGFTA